MKKVVLVSPDSSHLHLKPDLKHFPSFSILTGQLGLGHEQNISHPSMVNFGGTLETQNIISVSCGHTHCIAITSAHSKSELEYRRHFMEKREKAIRTLGRFSKHCLLRIRMARCFHIERSPVSKRIETKEATCSPHSSQVSNTLSEWDTSTTLSDSLSSIDIVQEKIPPCDIICRSTQEIEVENMYKEDRRDTMIARDDRHRRKVYEQRKKLLLTEIIRQHENHSMMKEDILSHLTRKAEREEKRRNFEAKERQQLKEKNAKARERIQAEVDRLMLARARKKKSSNEEISRKSRKIRVIRKTKIPLEYEKVKSDQVVLDDINVPKVMKSSDKWNKILLKRRGHRLHLQQKEGEDECLKKMRQLERQHIALRKTEIEAKQRYEQKIKQIQSELITKNRIASIEQKEIEENVTQIQAPTNTINNRNPKFFRSVTHWTQKLVE